MTILPKLIVKLVLLNIIQEAITISDNNIRSTLKGIPEDGLRTFDGISERYGHLATEHEVITEDNYVLKLFNIPGDTKRIVLLAHGVFDTSDGWIVKGNNSLAIMLADRGYDVWALNVRGNRYSKNHLTLDPDANVTFWDYSAHEFGYYDLAANIDYILKYTGQSQLSIVGFSEGTTMTIILGSRKTEYNQKIKAFIALAPIAFLYNTEGPLTTLINSGPLLNYMLPETFTEVAGYNSLTKGIMNLLCTQLVIGYDICYDVAMNPLIGPNQGIDRSFFSTVMGHFPAGTSRKNLIHFSQMGLKGFAEYDYGTGKNLEVYRSFVPPSYDLNKVTMNTYLISGKIDRVSTLKDVEILNKKLPNVIEWKTIDNYNHMDHLWADDAQEVEYPYIIEVLDKYN